MGKDLAKTSMKMAARFSAIHALVRKYEGSLPPEMLEEYDQILNSDNPGQLRDKMWCEIMLQPKREA